MNDRSVNPTHQTHEFRILTTRINTVLLISKIRAKITFSGLAYSINLPLGKFCSNTHGKCGKTCVIHLKHDLVCLVSGMCDNNRTDNGILPSGVIDPSCSNMAHEWHTNDTYCEPLFVPTPTPHCDTSICNIIQNRCKRTKQKYI